MSVRTRRRIFVTTAAIVLTVLMASVLPGCSFNLSCGTEEPTGVKTYTDLDYGYTFDYPAAWVLEEDSTAEVEGGISAAKGVSAFDPDGARANKSYVDIFQVSIYELGITVDESALPEVKPELERVLADIAGQDSSWKTLEAMTDAQVGGLSGFKTLVTHTMDGEPVNSTLYFLFDGSTEYELMLQAATENWETIQADFDAILASFKPGAATETTE